MIESLNGEGMPIPSPDQDTESFWEGTANGELLVQRCQTCRRWIWQPQPICPKCHLEATTWERVSERASVVSWIVVHPPVVPAMESLTPFVVLLVQLTEGIRMTGNLVDTAGRILRADEPSFEHLRMGGEVSLRWREQRGWVLPAWTMTRPGMGSDQ